MKRKKKETPLRAAIYIRVSSTRQHEEGYSYEEQERILSAHCEARGYELTEVYGDAGISGGEAATKLRLGFLKLCNDASDRKFDLVLVWKLSRFARSLKVLTSVLSEFDALGVALVSYTETFDSSTPAGKLMRNIIGSFAEFERDCISENVRMGRQGRARKGMHMFTFVLGYRVTATSLTIIPDEAEIVRYIHMNYQTCKSLTELAENVNAKGYRGRRGGLFTPWSCQKILTNPTYAGVFRFKGELYEPSFKYETILSKDEFNATQRILLRMGRLYGRKPNDDPVLL